MPNAPNAKTPQIFTEYLYFHLSNIFEYFLHL